MDRKALGVIEAKKPGTTLSTVADQSARYANSLPPLLASGLTGTLPKWGQDSYRPLEPTNVPSPATHLLREVRSRVYFEQMKGRGTHATWTEDRLWHAFAVTAPGKVKGRSQAGRFADLVTLVRFTLEQQPVLAPSADTVHKRFEAWLASPSPLKTEHLKLKTPEPRSCAFTPEQISWLRPIRDHIATSLSIHPEDFDYTPFGERGGYGRAHQLFGKQLPTLLEELNTGHISFSWWGEPPCEPRVGLPLRPSRWRVRLGGSPTGHGSPSLHPRN